MTAILLSYVCCCGPSCYGYPMSLCEDCGEDGINDWPADSTCPDCDVDPGPCHDWGFIRSGYVDILLNSDEYSCNDDWYFNKWGRCWTVSRSFLEDTENEVHYTGLDECFHDINPIGVDRYFSCCECCMCCSACHKEVEVNDEICKTIWDTGSLVLGAMRMSVTAQSVVRQTGATYSVSVGEPDVCDLTCDECNSSCQPPTCDSFLCNCTLGCRLRGGTCTAGNNTQAHNPCGPGTTQIDECGQLLNDEMCRCSCDGTNRACNSTAELCDDCYIPSVGLCPDIDAPSDALTCSLDIAQGVTSASGSGRANGSRYVSFKPKHYELDDALMPRTSCGEGSISGVDGDVVHWSAPAGSVSVFQNDDCYLCTTGGTDLSECSYDIPSCGYECGSSSTDYSADCIACCDDDCGSEQSRNVGVTWRSDWPTSSGLAGAGYLVYLEDLTQGLYGGSDGFPGLFVAASTPCSSATLVYDHTLEWPVDNSGLRINQGSFLAESQRLTVTVTLTPNTTTGETGTGLCNYDGSCLCDSE